MAFRTAAEGSDPEDQLEDAPEAFAIQSPDVFQNVVTTTLRFTPVVLAHHLPAKKMANGKLYVLSTLPSCFMLT